MTPASFDFVQFQALVDELVQAVQVVVLTAEHLELAASATAQDARTISRSLRRVSTALQRLKATGGDR
jgi:hypothetical protein